MLFLVVESHAVDTSVPAVCGAEQCALIALAHHQILLAALKHYDIYTHTH
jgi:hypothetical protein